jgi:hypothetical protein
VSMGSCANGGGYYHYSYSYVHFTFNGDDIKMKHSLAKRIQMHSEFLVMHDTTPRRKLHEQH